jgi:hypothetical protein
MSFVATAVTVYSGYKQEKAARKAAKEAKAQALRDRRLADEEEIFSETEGEGLGQLGQISLEIDDDETEEGLSGAMRKKLSKTLSI